MPSAYSGFADDGPECHVMVKSSNHVIEIEP